MQAKEIRINDAYLPYLDDENRFLLLYGGAGSGKSVFAAQKICYRFLYEAPHKFLIIRNTAATIKDSVFSEIKKTLSDWGQLRRCVINKAEHRITLDNGNEIVCKGLDDEEKIKSIVDLTGMWIEETTELKEDAFNQLNLRIRGRKKNYVQYILSFNPISEDHWIKSNLIDLDNADSTFVHTTYKDNYYIDEDYKNVLEGYKETNSLYYQIYCLGEWGVVDKSNKFLYSFDHNVHVKPVSLDKNLQVKLSFDFNIEPFAVQVYQTPDPNTINFIDKIRLNDSDIFQVCDHIKAKYPYAFFVVTGDATGKSRTGTTRGKTSYWKNIKTELQLRDPQIRVRSVNLGLIESRVLCNAALQHRTVNIDPSLTELISDCKFAKVDEKGILVKDRGDNKRDDLDGFRYALDIEWQDLIYRPKRRNG